VGHGLIHVSTHMKSGEDAAWWMRATVCLARQSGQWKIVHEHTSVPFYMDGSYRAAIDLSP
jgi:ketosteroid isomerase-like protein